VGKPEGRDHCGDPDVDGRIILRWIFMKWDKGVWIGLSWLWIEAFDCCNEHSGSIKCGEFLD
jgi:hypothetical protein